MLIAQIILLCIQCFNLLALIILGVCMAVSDARYKKRQEEYKRKYQEIQNKYDRDKSQT